MKAALQKRNKVALAKNSIFSNVEAASDFKTEKMNKLLLSIKNLNT